MCKAGMQGGGVAACGMSCRAAMRVSTMANCESRPRQSSIAKKSTYRSE